MEVKAVINVAIVEDEQEAVEYLSDCLHRYGEKTGETFSFTHFPEPITFLEKYKPVYDLVFMLSLIHIPSPRDKRQSRMPSSA